MSRYDDGWAAYVPVAQRRRQAVRAMAKLAKRGHPVAPVKIEGRAITTTFWGNAWCGNLESYRDLENRLKRGRTYVRNGTVFDLQIAPREVKATVAGSSLYTVTVNIGEVPKKQWASICADCAGGIDSLVELLQGRFSKGVMERIVAKGSVCFPSPPRSASPAVVPTTLRCASTSRRYCTGSARGSTGRRNCCSACVR